jgi:hypothetical protein
MHHSIWSGTLHRSARLALLLGALPLSLIAQVRRPDPVPAGPRASGKLPKKRAELLLGAGTVGLNEANATKKSMPVASVGFRHQFRPEWLYLGAMVDVGRTTVNGEFFPYEKRAIGDTLQFVAVNGNATMVAGRFTADILWPLDEAERFRAGAGANVGVYGVLPSGAGSTIVAPTFGAAFVGEGDITSRIGFMASLGFAQLLNFDREKLRPSDPALADPVFTTPLSAPLPAVKSFGGARIVIGLTYRLGVKKTPRSTR